MDAAGKYTSCRLEAHTLIPGGSPAAKVAFRLRLEGRARLNQEAVNGKEDRVPGQGSCVGKG